MKTRILSTARRSLPFASAIAALLATSATKAATYYWDDNAAGGGFGTAGASTGTWAAPTAGPTAGWSLSTTGANAFASFTTATTDTVNFGNGATGLAAGSITVSGTVNTGNMTFASGSGAITLAGGIINLGGGRTVTMNNTGNVISSELALSGATTFSTGEAGGAVDRTLTLGVLSGTGGTTFQYTGGSNGKGVFVLNGTSTYTGTTLISTTLENANTEVRLGVVNALPTTTVLTIGGAAGTGTSPGRETQLNLNGRNQTLAGLATTGGGTLRTQNVFSSSAATLTINDSGNRTFAGRIGNGGTNVTIVKQGTGIWTLTGANTYVGSTTISGGAINIQNATALGGTTNGTSVASGAALQIQGGIAVGAEAITLNGDGITSTGALRNISGTNSLSGAIILGSASRINSDAGTLTLTGGITGTGLGLTIGGVGATTLSTNGINTGAAGTLTKDGTGTLTLNAANNYTGLTAVSAGILIANNNSALGTTAGGTTVTSGVVALGNGITITGEEITIGQGLTADNLGALRTATGANATWDGKVILAANARVGAAAATTLTVSGIIEDGAGSVLNISGQSGTGTVLISGTSNTYTGITNVIRGILKIGATNALPVGTVLDVDFGGAVEDSSFDLNGFDQTVAGLQRTGSGSGTGGSIVTNSGGSVKTLTVNQSSTTTFSGNVTGNLALTKSGAGALTLSGTTITYTGATLVDGGDLSIANYTGLNSTSGITVSGGTAGLNLVQQGTGTTTNTINKSLSLHGFLRTTGGTSTNRLNLTWQGNTTLAGSSTITNNGNSSFIITGGIDLGAHTLTYQADGTGSRIDGNIIGTGGSLIKTSFQDLTLSGTNTYTGTTTVVGGRLQFAKQASLYNNNSLNWTTANINVQSGGTLAFNVGGTGEFTTSDVTTLLTNLATSSGTTDGMNAGSNFGFDTTNAGGSFTIADVIADSTGAGGGARGLVKLGTGTLVLTNTNTYTGSTTISAGTLRLENTAALATTSLLAIGTSTLQIATDSPLSGPSISINGGTIVSDRATPGAGLTHVLGNAAVSNATHNFTRGSNVTSGDAAIQLGNITNASGANGTATFNPTTANLFITGGYTGVTNGGLNTLALGGSAAANSLAGDITLGSRTQINVTKTGSSLWTLSGNHGALAGTTTISAGALITTTLAALPNNTAVTFNGGVLGAQIGGAGWTTGEVDTLLAGATKTSGALGIDTTNGSLTQWTDFTTTNLGPALGLAKLGANTLTLNSAGNNYAGTTIIDQGTLKLDVDHTLAGGLTFGFGNNTTSNTGTLDLSTNSATFGGALVAQTNSASASTITIGSGQTLQLNGAVTVGFNSSVNSATKLSATGDGTLAFGTSGTPTNANVQIGNGQTSSAGNAGTLDLSGLANFNAYLGTGTFRIGSPTNGTGSNTNGGSTVILAAASTISATTLQLSSEDGAGATQTLKLGGGTNVLNANTINVAGGRANGTVDFNGATGSVTVRSLADPTNGRATLNLAVSTFGTGGSITGTFDTTGHTADLRFGTMTLGSRGATGSWTGGGTGNFSFDTGTLDANDLSAGFITGTAANAMSATGTMNLSGGTATFNATNNALRLGSNTRSTGSGTGNLNISGTANVTVAANGGNSIVLGNATVAGGTATGNINITGGSLTVAGDIIRGAATGTSNATLTLNGSTAILDMGGNDMGASGSGAITLNAESGTLKNVASINGNGGLTKTTAGTLTLDGINSYTGDTVVSDGTLVLADNAQLKFVLGATSGDNNSISGAGTATLNGDFVIDTSAADALSSGSWTLENVTSLTGPYGASFTVVGFTPVGTDQWEKDIGGGKKYTFDETTGVLTLTSTGGPTYASWIDSFFSGETDPAIIGANADPDDDGIPNAVEMVIGGDPKDGMDTALLPTLELVTDPVSTPAIPAGNYLLFTYRRTDLSVNAGVTADCETDNDLVGPWTPATGAPGVVIQVDDNATFTPPATTDTDRVRVYVPRGSNTELFGRLNVQVPTP